MIDTVALTLSNSFWIHDHSKFNPSTAGLFGEPYYPTGKNGYVKCVQNPTSAELQNGVYKPRLTAVRRMGTKVPITTLRIEFSIPKLIFGNNFDEVSERDFQKVVDQLKTRLHEMGVYVPLHLLMDAPVSAIHYSKNIPLTDYSTPSNLLKELSKADLNQKLDLNQTDFRNGGHSLKFRANSFEIVLYDKIKDLAKGKHSEKRAIEWDYTIQEELFAAFKPKKPFEVLRFEVRLGNRAKIKALLKKLNLSCGATFKELFREQVSKTILEAYYQEIVGNYALLPSKPNSWRDFLLSLRTQHPRLKPRKILQLAGMAAVCQELGIREFREAIGSYGSHHWPRLKKDLLTYAPNSGISQPFSVIGTALQEFRPLKLADYAQDNCRLRE